jgi:D-sedoheptulose 7-phosphate isomerase
MEEIRRELCEGVELRLRVAESQAPVIQTMIECVWDSMQRGGKLLICGNAAECMVRMHTDRNPLSAVALTTDSSILTAIGNDYEFDAIFARQVLGLGRAGDVLLAISTSGNSRNVVLAVEEAKRLDMRTLGLLGKDGGSLVSMVDTALVIPSSNTQRIQELHITVGHILCAALERKAVLHAVDASKAETEAF